MGVVRRTRAVEKAGRPQHAHRLDAAVERSAGGNGTRERLIATAERLFAEQGISVSNRQIGEAAGQANNSVVGYHFGTKSDLVLAILRRHAPQIERRRAEMLEEVAGSKDLAEWLACVVKPTTDHLESLGNPSWYARFLAQAATDPVLRQVVLDETLASPSMRDAVEGVMRRLPVLPPELHQERGDMTLHLVVHMLAERERALQDGARTPRATWDEAANGLVDALLGLWRAPVRGSTRAKEKRR